MKSKTIIVTGPTATGKTALAVDLARQFTGEVFSADSRQVYKGLDIGTGKDLEEYCGTQPVPFHLIDIADPMEDFSLFHWRTQFIDAFADTIDKKSLPIICGGTALYLDMLLKNYELAGGQREYREADFEKMSLENLISKLQEVSPEVYAKTDLGQKNRVIRALEIASSTALPQAALPEMDFLMLAPYWHRKTVHARIEQRLHERWLGMIAETKLLIDQGVTHEKLDWFGLEYRYMSRFLTKQITEKEAFEQLLIKIRQFAKRQDVWFRKMERAGTQIHWLTADDKLQQACHLVELFTKGEKLPEPDLKLSETVYGPRTQ
jgi:tRNA dimethylallyltransferase